MTPDSITLGIAVSLSGRYALLGRQVLEGLECYIRDVNAGGGMRLGSENRKLPVSLIVEDDESDEAKVRSLTEKLIADDKVDLLMGTLRQRADPGRRRDGRGRPAGAVES